MDDGEGLNDVHDDDINNKNNNSNNDHRQFAARTEAVDHHHPINFLPWNWFSIMSIQDIQQYVELQNPTWFSTPFVSSSSSNNASYHHLPLHYIIRHCSNNTIPNNYNNKILLFEMIQFLYHSYPDAIHIPDADGWLPLHLAVACQVSYEIVQFILNFFPEACTIPDTDGYLPLHLYLIHNNNDNADVDNIDEVHLDHAVLEETEHEDNTILTLLLKEYPDAVNVLVPSDDTTATTVLHLAVQRSVKDSFLQLIIQTNPNSIQLLDGNDNLPIHYIHKDLSDESFHVLIQSYPQSAQRMNSHGILPLTIALLNECSSIIIQTLVDNYPQAVQMQDPITGNLPLHLFMSKVALDDEEEDRDLFNDYDSDFRFFVNDNDEKFIIIQILVAAYPESLLVLNEQKETPLHCIFGQNPQLQQQGEENEPGRQHHYHPKIQCRYLLIIRYITQQNSNCLHSQDSKDGMIPLHRACCFCMFYYDRRLLLDLLRVINLLIDACPTSLRIVDNFGQLPIKVALSSFVNSLASDNNNIINNQPFQPEHRNFRKIIELMLRQFPESFEIIFQDLLFLTSKDLNYMYQLLMPIIQKDPLFLQSPINHANYKNNTQLPLHIAFMSDNVPLRVIKELAKLYPDALVTYDSHGCTPFHYACNNKNILQRIEKMNSLRIQDREDIQRHLTDILTLRPEAATTVTLQSRILPLFLACENDAPLDIIFFLLEYSKNELFGCVCRKKNI